MKSLNEYIAESLTKDVEKAQQKLEDLKNHLYLILNNALKAAPDKIITLKNLIVLNHIERGEIPVYKLEYGKPDCIWIYYRNPKNPVTGDSAVQSWSFRDSELNVLATLADALKLK